jgi:hypothetical protein
MSSASITPPVMQFRFRKSDSLLLQQIASMAWLWSGAQIKGIPGQTCIACRCSREAAAIGWGRQHVTQCRGLGSHLYWAQMSLQPLVWAPENVQYSKKQCENIGGTVDGLHLLCLALFTFILSKISATSVMSWSAPGCPARAVLRL